MVELSPAVVAGAEWFRHVNGDLLRRPNVRMHVDDGRNVLLLTAERFDAITADIIQPHHAGAGSLYSVEYFRLAREALQDDGVMVQWISQRSGQHYKLILRTFLSVFEEASLWGDGSLVVGSTAAAASHGRLVRAGGWRSRERARRWLRWVRPASRRCRHCGSPTGPRCARSSATVRS